MSAPAQGDRRSSRRRSSLILRFTLAYAGLFCLTVGGLLGFLYWSTVEAQRRAIDQSIVSESEGLRSALVGLSVSEVAAVVTRRSSESPGQREIYVLATRTREIVAGNLRAWPAGIEPEPGVHEFALAPSSGAGSAEAVARGRFLDLPSGERLLVGRNVTDLEQLRVRILHSLIGAFLLSALLGVGGGYVFSRRVSARLDEINRNSEAILEGDLARRMSVGGRGDEFDELALNLNRMLDRLEGLMTGMREVADDIAHDMRSPISRLRTRIEVALMGPPDPAAYRRVLEQTVADAEDILTMFNALLTIALADSGAPRDRFAELDLAAIARETAELYEPLAEEKGIALELDAPSALPLRGEPHLLGQALANLIDNAVKYVPSGGHIAVRLGADGERVRIAVEDDGPGIPESFRDKAIERFARYEASRSAPGSGLGLSVARAIARLHGGRIALEDAAPGLRAVIELPRSPV